MTASDVQRRELVLSVDWGQKWPLSDIMWWEEDQPNWNDLIGTALIERLRRWAAFFNENADLSTKGFKDDADDRHWFESEGVRLRDVLREKVGDRYEVVLKLWF